MKKIAGIFCVSMALAGCIPNFVPDQSQSSYYHQEQPMYTQQQAAPQMMQQQQQQQQAPVYVRPDTNETVDKVNTLVERVRRVERAMIRLDRRMQLIERNELSRMSNGVMNNDEASAPQGGFQPMSYNSNQAQPQTLPIVKRPYARQAPVSNRGGYQPVSYKDNRVTSSLGVARNVTAGRAPITAFGGMPSIADSQDKSHNAAESSVSIWTINYESGKVWPGREQLTSSREVINALSGKKPAAIYARGANPSSKEFRERVRAVSKYLSKVTKVDNMPIASMPAKHMTRNQIEIIVTK
ncbi:MAG: hypothetical protein ACI9TY_000420 [Alphaproteobacteria bacterium]|jgi:hypothetical protein